MGKGTVLTIEDDKDIAELLGMYLGQSGYDSITCDGWDALSLLQTKQIDIILLDVMLNGANGFELCPELKRLTDVPILFMSARADGTDKILGLDLGADDFIAKPFNPNEVVARVAAHLRRYRALKLEADGVNGQVIRIADLEIDEESFTVRCGQHIIYLSAKEFQLLKIMAQNPQHVFKPDELYQSVWKSDTAGDVRTVMVHISNLRKKIEPKPANPKYIVTIRGMGYKFMADEQRVV